MSEINNKIDYWLSLGNEAVDWYSTASNFCEDLAKRFNVEKEIVVGVLSALSPLKKWDLNKKETIRFFEKNEIGHLPLQVAKVKAINRLRGQSDLDDKIMNILAGNKTKAFYHNIMYPESSHMVTLDTWMIRALDNPSRKSLTTKQYNNLANQVIIKSHDIQLIPCQTQAIIWENIRKVHATKG